MTESEPDYWRQQRKAMQTFEDLAVRWDACAMRWEVRGQHKKAQESRTERDECRIERDRVAALLAQWKEEDRLRWKR